MKLSASSSTGTVSTGTGTVLYVGTRTVPVLLVGTRSKRGVKTRLKTERWEKEGKQGNPHPLLPFAPAFTTCRCNSSNRHRYYQQPQEPLVQTLSSPTTELPAERCQRLLGEFGCLITIACQQAEGETSERKDCTHNLGLTDLLVSSTWMLCVIVLSSLKTHAIWQQAIGHDPYAAPSEANQEENDRGNHSEGKTKLKEVMNMARSQNVTDSANRSGFTAQMYRGLKKGKQRRGEGEKLRVVDPSLQNVLDDPSSSSEEEFVVVKLKREKKKKSSRKKESRKRHSSSEHSDSSSVESARVRKRERKRKGRKHSRSRKAKGGSISSDESSSDSGDRKRRKNKRRKNEKKNSP